MIEQSANKICDKSCHHGYEFWRPVIIAAIVGVGLNFLISLLYISFGFMTFSTNKNGVLAFSAGGFIGLTALSIMAMFFIGWLASYLGKSYDYFRYAGELYGLTTWCLTLILSIFLATSVGKFINNSEYLISKNMLPMPMQQYNYSRERESNLRVGIERHLPVEYNPLENKAGIAGMTSFLTFFVFFIGALSSCLGGRVAKHYSQPWPFDDNIHL